MVVCPPPPQKKGKPNLIMTWDEKDFILKYQLNYCNLLN